MAEYGQTIGTGTLTKLATTAFNTIKAQAGARLKVYDLAKIGDAGAKNAMKHAMTAVSNFMQGSLEAGTAVREILNFEYTFSRAVDKENQPSGPPRGGLLTVTVKASNSGNCELHRWMTTGRKFSGKIEVFAPGTTKRMKDIDFIDGFCVGYTEKWDESSATHTEKITIACKQIEHGGAQHLNQWGALYSKEFKKAEEKKAPAVPGSGG